MRMIIINKENDGKKLNTVLLKEFPALSINAIYKALRKKDIRVNNVKINENVTLHVGDLLKVFITDDILLGKKSSKININIIYEDNNIILVNKPVGIEVTGENSLTSILSDMLQKEVYPCHRLDRNTSGLTLFAKNNEAQDILFNKFKSHEIEKHYIARVYGIPKNKHSTLNAYLFKDNKKSIVYISDIPKKGYQNIITEYTILSVDKKSNTSILEVILHTGRTHQIRAHLAHIGYPIIGDGKYGINSVNKSFGCKTQNLQSYYMEFNFTTDSGILNYLKKKEFKLEKIGSWE